MRRENPLRTSRATITFLACVLMTYACTVLLNGVHADSPQDALWAGAILGVGYLLVRPILRILTMPVGCLTLGLSNFVIDVALLLLCDTWIAGFAIDGILWAMVASLCINSVTWIAGGLK